MPDDSRGEVARQVILGFAAGLASAFGVVPGAIAQAAVPAALAVLHVMGGTRLEDIARLVGHSGSAVTERVYRHEIRPALVQGAEVLDRLFDVP
jgi:hypothetical protein